MTGARIAALPMYDFAPLREAHDALWLALARRLVAAGVADVPIALMRTPDHVAGWLDPGLLLGQACEYPLASRFPDRVRLVATPHYLAPGCEAARYRSVIVVRAADPARGLQDLRDRRCVINEPDSNSGMNLLRATIAPLARDGRFFGAVAVSGSHLASATQVAEGLADVAAIDCVSFAHFQRWHPVLTAQLRILAWTAASPCLPLITSASTDDRTLGLLRAALDAVSADAALAEVRARLLLASFSLNPDESFAEVRALAQAAVVAGYPSLA
jgi:ABC-type phosphate/phosphonate transport system substrate-binding protein